jgi:hypothetical protein
MGRKMVRFGSLRLTISRQDESIEVHEVGSQRLSLGGNGGHVLSLYPLTWRSLGRIAPPPPPPSARLTRKFSDLLFSARSPERYPLGCI